jgi:glycosyltransferase involved in cell wall biosynthesis
MRILIVTDAWHPQVNGVVRTLEATAHHLGLMGHEVEVVGPDLQSWRMIAAPTYPSIKLELFAGSRLQRLMGRFNPDLIHIATEGPLGWAARNLCLKLQRPFTTSYHTRFPEYLEARVPRLFQSFVRTLAYAALRRFHAPSSALLVATPSIERELQKRKFRRIVRWSRGVDTDLFRPYGKDDVTYVGLPRPILLYAGRIAPEKNLDAFLKAETPGSKIIIGEGPDSQRLKTDYPLAHFLGEMEGEILARHYAAADLFVFPSASDTFGLVLLEAMACGLRVAAMPAPGPRDIFAGEGAERFAVLNDNLQKAIEDALDLPQDASLPRDYVAKNYSWEKCTTVFFDHLQASTPEAIKRIARLRHWMSRNWQRALALAFK